ncbi:MAG: hypothetical protein HFI08_02285 [Bacilli bacterium]|nr:hypothetical protein [Bacilli bacterium]
MKKIAIVSVLILVLLITGCEGKIKTLTCTKESVEDNLKTSEEMLVSYKNNKVFKITQTTIEEMDPDLIDTTISFGENFASTLNQVDGFEVNYSKESNNSVKYQITMDYSKMDMNKLKELFGDDWNEEDYIKAKDQDIEEFKKERLEGYSCK